MDCWDRYFPPPHPYINIHPALKELVMLSDEIYRIAEGPWTWDIIEVGSIWSFSTGELLY